jgi:ABC-type multidrug transport system ATPase subunit
MPVASLTAVSKLFGPVAALRSVTCELLAGRAYLVLGDNGAGKSTLLRILAGLSQPSAGDVLIFGQPVDECSETIGYMGHDTMLYDELTALENLRYYATLYSGKKLLRPEDALAQVGLTPGNINPVGLLQVRRGQIGLAQLGLAPDDTNLVGKYSQGMRQRCSLARVLMLQPKLLLLDEPFSNMDRKSALEMLAQLKTLRDNGATIVLTTHQPELAASLADETWHLRRGELVIGAAA